MNFSIVAAPHLGSGEFGVGRGEEAVLRYGAFEMLASKRVVALGNGLRAAHEFAVGGVPVKVLRRVDGTRLRHRARIGHVGRNLLHVADRSPMLGESLGRARREGLVLERRFIIIPARLVKAASGLKLCVLPVGICLELHPEKSIGRHGLKPYLAAELLVRLVAVVAAEAEIAPPNAVEAIMTREDVVRLGATPLVARHVVDATAVLLHNRPCTGLDFAFVSNHVLSREEELRIVLDGIRRVHPMIVGSGKRGRIVPDNVRLEFLRVFRKTHLHLPKRARDVVERSHEAARGAVGILAGEPVNRCSRVGVVSDDAEVEFDSPRRPRAAHGDVSELHHVVREEEITARLPVRRRPYLASNLREHDHADVVVFECHRLPFRRRTFMIRAVVAKVRIARLRSCRDRIWVRKRIRLHLHLTD